MQRAENEEAAPDARRQPWIAWLAQVLVPWMAASSAFCGSRASSRGESSAAPRSAQPPSGGREASCAAAADTSKWLTACVLWAPSLQKQGIACIALKRILERFRGSVATGSHREFGDLRTWRITPLSAAGVLNNGWTYEAQDGEIMQRTREGQAEDWRKILSNQRKRSLEEAVAEHGELHTPSWWLGRWLEQEAARSLKMKAGRDGADSVSEAEIARQTAVAAASRLKCLWSDGVGAFHDKKTEREVDGWWEYRSKNACIPVFGPRSAKFGSGRRHAASTFGAAASGGAKRPRKWPAGVLKPSCTFTTLGCDEMVCKCPYCFYSWCDGGAEQAPSTTGAVQASRDCAAEAAHVARWRASASNNKRQRL